MNYQVLQVMDLVACLEFHSQRKVSHINFINFNPKNPYNLHVIIKHQIV